MVKVRFTTLVASDPKLNYNKHTEELGWIKAGAILLDDGISISVPRMLADELYYENVGELKGMEI